MNTGVSMDPTPTNAAKAGDLIMYRYKFRSMGMWDWTITNRAVTSVKKDDAGKVIGYHVEGGYLVELKHVQSVIPMAPAPSRGEEFPLEAGQ